MNKVFLSGNLTRDPELKRTAGGLEILSFGIAVNERKKQGDEWVDVPNFFDCTMFGKRAASLSDMLSKGSKVCVECRAHYSSWEKDGQKRNKVDFIVDEIELMSQPKQKKEPAYGYYEEDIPF